MFIQASAEFKGGDFEDEGDEESQKSKPEHKYSQKGSESEADNSSKKSVVAIAIVGAFLGIYNHES